MLELRMDPVAMLIGQSLTVATVKADQVFLPVLENASKAYRVRSTLSVFERSKFFFNLPGSLLESVENVEIFLHLGCQTNPYFLGEIRSCVTRLQEGQVLTRIAT